MNKRTPLVAILTMGIFSFLFGQDLSAFEKRTFVDAQGDTLRYRILYPAKYKRDRQYPFVLFLHGAGERGQDNEKQLTHGARMWTDKANRKKFPAIVVFPQCETDDYWAHMTVNEVEGVRYRDFPIQQEPKPSLSRVMQLVDELLQTESIDPARQYVMGLSMGAMGTFELLSRMPDRFAAAVPICGGGDPSLTLRYAPYTSIWIFHGDQDDVVLPEYSRRMHKALQSAGGRVRYTEYLGVNHNSWDPAFAEKELLPWLFSHRRQ